MIGQYNPIVDKMIALGKWRGAPDDKSAICYTACILALLLVLAYGAFKIIGFISSGSYELLAAMGGAEATGSITGEAMLMMFVTTPVYIIADIIFCGALVFCVYRLYRESGVIWKILMTLVLLCIVFSIIGYPMMFEFCYSTDWSDPGNQQLQEALASLLAALGNISGNMLMTYILYVGFGAIACFFLLLIFAPRHWLSRKLALYLIMSYILLPIAIASFDVLIVLILVIIGAIVASFFSVGGSEGDDGGKSTAAPVMPAPKAQKKKDEATIKKIPRSVAVFRGGTVFSGNGIFRYTSMAGVYYVCSQSEYDKGKVKIVDESGQDHEVLPAPPAEAKPVLADWEKKH